MEERKEKNKKKEIEKEIEKDIVEDMYRIATPFDITVKLDQLKNVVDYVLLTLDELEKSVKKLSRRAKSDSSDILFFLFFLALMMKTQQTLTTIPQPTPSKNLTVEEIQKILRECRRSTNPIECVENQLFGG
jgi:hypothetical protein